MQTVQSLHDRNEIARFLCQEPERRLYELGDLDDFFWPYTSWYSLQEQQKIQQLLLLYTGTQVATLLCTGRERGAELLAACKHLLPKSFYAHILPTYTPLLQDDYTIVSHGLHYKYALHHTDRLEGGKQENAQVIQAAELEMLLTFYKESYPGNWFDARMLGTGQYYGIWRQGRLASVAGIHVYSPEYKAAVLGNVTTHPDYRGEGLGTAVCARLCRELLKRVEYVGLNVKADNQAAIKVYERIGFEKVETYEEVFCQGS